MFFFGIFILNSAILLANASWEDKYSEYLQYFQNNRSLSQNPRRILSDPWTTCGIRSSEFRIIKGTKAANGAWPWLVALGYRDDTKDPNFQCGGALITPTVVLTAAHCVHNRPGLYLARMGSNDLTSFVGQDLPIEEAIVHALYNPDSNENDIALVKLEHPVRITRSVQLLCLPALGAEAMMQNGSKAWIAGWGATSYLGPSSPDLMELNVNIVNQTVCKKAYEVFGHAAVLDDRVFCAAGEPRRDACQGDSGGPLMMELERKFYALGIVSFGYKCAEPNFPGVYTSVPAFLSWINRQLDTILA